MDLCAIKMDSETPEMIQMTNSRMDFYQITNYSFSEKVSGESHKFCRPSVLIAVGHLWV